MMQDKELGIVLKKPVIANHTLCLISETLGKTDIFIKIHPLLANRIHPGTLISFTPMQYRNTWRTNTVAIVTNPIINSVEDCYWLHHLLELYYYFTVEGTGDRSLFHELIHHLTIINNSQTPPEIAHTLNMLCVIDFLVKTGFYSSPALTHYQQCFNDLIKEQSTDLNLTKQKVLWYIKDNEYYAVKKIITNCLETHPQYARFNTVPFVYSC